jgi:cyclopropane-fatty-acyl-phospholipid synthase
MLSSLPALQSVRKRLSLDAVADRTLFGVLDRALTDVRMRFVLSQRTYDVGRTADPEGTPSFVIRVSDPGFSRRVLSAGNLGLAETYMEQGWTLEKGRLDQFITQLALANVDSVLRRDPRVLARVAAMRVHHVFTGPTQNVKLHYEVGPEVYELFLDETMGYTCGYQKTPNDTLRELQENKYDRVCQKLRVKPGDELLDLGCGWGGLIIHAAQKYGVKARGITIAKAQAEFAMRRARSLGLEDRVKVDCGDFREARGTYDHIVSIGMYEHLYHHEHPAMFRRINEMLRDDGMGLVHFMGCTSDKNDPDPFTQKYIFPGSTHPPLSTAVVQLEKQKLAVLDVENIGRHYRPTAQYWYDNFQANKHKLDGAKYDARFVRMYEYLMAIYVAGTTSLVSGLFQVLFTKNFRKNLPTYRV